METQLDLGPAARQAAALLDGVRERHFDAPTPCAAYTVRDLLRHLLGLTVAFRDAARKDFGPATRTDPADPDAPRPEPAGDWRGRLRTQLDELVAAWRDPAAWRGETEAGGITLPAPVAGAVALNEVFLHGWDLARATGQPYRGDEATARASLALLAQSADAAERAATGFGPAVPVAPDAPLLERAVACSGRLPSWSPGGR
ncbi:TIGR03086 family metal-binding protein [Streptomyces sp. XM4011]|uniref:TIGR03086 family metal-binding protein n=1 Tax=Streptomyces sp. XM4011 TaxID=2929780 RepID=UPI001FF75517|nr:TIGR03086 family metal-binding protein [Streptomyces sp. XM4011]MCK1814289.1 TIGR03086 family metal-binding protein [Streptomyces sp. XM4011]